MGTAAAPSPQDGSSSKLKGGAGGALKALDEVAKWKGRWDGLAWIVALLAPIVSSVLVWLFHTGVSYFHILLQTAPLTVAVIFLVMIFRNAKMTNPLGYVITTILVLAGAAFLSKLFSVGAPVEWKYQMGQVDSSGEYHTNASGIGVLFGILGAVVSAYYHVYGEGAFFTSVGTGLIAGWWLSDRR